MSRRADAPQCGGVVVEFESDSNREARDQKSRSATGKQVSERHVYLVVSTPSFGFCVSPKVQLLSTSGVPSFSSMSVELCPCG